MAPPIKAHAETEILGPAGNCRVAPRGLASLDIFSGCRVRLARQRHPNRPAVVGPQSRDARALAED
eukprot:8376266-Pyramimonas_sp.AAC.1